MRFLADMGVDIRVAQWLRDQGYDAVHLRDQGLQCSTDESIFQKARSEDRVLLTYDLDFNTIAYLTREKHASIILFRLQKAKYPEIIRRLQTVLADSTEALQAGCVVVVDEKRHRVRRLPIGETNPESGPVAQENPAAYKAGKTSRSLAKRLKSRRTTGRKKK